MARRGFGCRHAVALGLAGGALVLTASTAGAHGGDEGAVHACVASSSGSVRIVGASGTCRASEYPLDWRSGVLQAGSVTGQGSNSAAPITGHLALQTVGRANLVPDAVGTDQLADDAVGHAQVSTDDTTNLTGANIRTGTLLGTLQSTRAASAGDLGIGTISGQGDNDDLPGDGGEVTGNLGLATVGRANLVSGAVDAGKLSSLLLADLVTEAELAALKVDETGTSGAKGPNDSDGHLHWNHLEGVPSGVLPGHPVRLEDILGLTTGSGGSSDGGIIGQHIKNGTITSADLAGRNLGSDGCDNSSCTVVGAVTSEKIADGTIETADLSGSLLSRLLTWGSATVSVGPREVPGGTRTAISVPVSGLQVGDLVTVSPPAGLENQLLFVGHDVIAQGAVVLYLYNIGDAEVITNQTWKVQHLDLTG